MKLAEHLYNELYRRGVEHAFGIPGDFALSLWAALEQSPIKGVVLAHEPSCGFAADAYARVRGMGLALVTYGVGGLNMVNPAAQAYAEKSPLVIVSGSPGIRERRKNPLLHHKVKTFDTQRRIYEEVTRGAYLLDNPLTADMKIQEALSLVERYKQPVYIEVPRDMVFVEIPVHEAYQEPRITDRGALLEAVEETVEMILHSEKPAILGCVEMHRFGLQKELRQLAEMTGIPVAATMLGKGVFPEDHPLYMGIYVGGAGDKETERYIEDSDCLLMLGTFLSDFNLGIFTADLKPEYAVHATSEQIQVRYHQYHDVPLDEYIHELMASPRLNQRHFTHPVPRELHPATHGEVTMDGVVEALNNFLQPHHMVVTDVGDCLFAGADLQTRHTLGFLSPAYYLSMGFAVPGALGAQAADPKARPVVLVGDGAFQMTGMELICASRYGLNPIVLLLNNGGYGTLKIMNPESSYLDVPNIDYAAFGRLLGGDGFTVNTTEELKEALIQAEASSRFSLLDIHIPANDISAILRGLGEASRARIGVVTV